MKSWWQGLQPREQRVLLIGLVSAALLMFYALVIDPYQKEMEQLRSSVADKRAALAWMQQQSAAISAARASGAGGHLPAGQSLMGVVDSSAKQFGIGSGVKRLQPEGDTTVKLWAEQIAFDDLVRWLDTLQHNYGIVIHDLSIEAQEQSGQVNLRVELRSPS